MKFKIDTKAETVELNDGTVCTLHFLTQLFSLPPGTIFRVTADMSFDCYESEKYKIVKVEDLI